MRRDSKYQLLKDRAIDSHERTIIHGDIIRNKPFLVKLYSEWYSTLKSLNIGEANEIIIELGSGSGFIKIINPNIITSDFVLVPNTDMLINAEKMPFQDNSVDSIVMIDVFHHISSPCIFLREAERVLKVKGTIVMSEPWNCFWSRLIYINFHHETFDVKSGWEIPNLGPLSGANGALPWIIFHRDRVLFEERFPGLVVEVIRPHTAVRYLLSGGLRWPQLVPGWMFGAATWVDGLLNKLGMSMFAYLVIRKKAPAHEPTTRTG